MDGNFGIACLERSAKRVGCAIGCIWLISILLGIGGTGAIIWVAAHFISKYW